MLPGRIFEHFSPYARIFTAVAPCLGAIVLRLVFGKNRLTRVMLSVTTVWFAANVMMAPFSEGMRRDLWNLQLAIFR